MDEKAKEQSTRNLQLLILTLFASCGITLLVLLIQAIFGGDDLFEIIQNYI